MYFSSFSPKMLRYFVVSVSLMASCFIVIVKLNSDGHWLVLDKMFEKTVMSPSVPGISVAVTTPRGKLWTRAFGYTDLEHRIKMEAGDRFPLGDMSQLVMSAGLMKLLEQQQISLDSKIADWLADLPPALRQISLRQLAAHTSGVHHRLQHLSQRLEAPAQGYQLLHQLNALQPHAKPGTEFHFSTYGWWLLAAVMEAIDDDRPIHQILEQEVLHQLKLDATHFATQQQLVPNRQRHYQYVNDRLQHALLTVNVQQSEQRQMMSTTTDMVSLAMALVDNEFLSQDSRQLMFHPYRLKNGTYGPMGLGWYIGYEKLLASAGRDPDIISQIKKFAQIHSPAVMHQSEKVGSSSLLILCLEHRHAVALAKNVSGENSADLMYLALQALNRAID